MHCQILKLIRVQLMSLHSSKRMYFIDLFQICMNTYLFSGKSDDDADESADMIIPYALSD